MYVDDSLFQSSLLMRYEQQPLMAAGLQQLKEGYALYPKIRQDRKLLIYSCPNPNTSIQNVTENERENYIKYFSNICKNNDYLYVSCEFKTNFYSRYVHCNYGVKISFWTQNGEHTIIFDSKMFNGDHQQFTSYTPQGALISLKPLRNLICGLKNVELFFEGDAEEIETMPSNTNIRFNNLIVDTIQEKDLEDIYTTEIINLTDTFSITNATDVIKLQPSLNFRNNKIPNNRIMNVSWYHRDCNINKNDKFFDIMADQGWRKFHESPGVEPLIISNNQNKIDNLYNCIPLPNNFTCEEEVKCIFQDKYTNTYFETPSIILYNHFQGEQDYDFKITVEDQQLGDDKYTALRAYGQYNSAWEKFDSINVKWYWIDTGYENGKPNTIQLEGLLTPIDETNYPLDDEHKRTDSNILSQIDISKKILNWDGELKIYADFIGVQTNIFGNEVSQQVLAHRSYNFKKAVTEQEFDTFFNNYLNREKKKDGSEWSKIARDWCQQEGYITSNEWKRFITKEEYISSIYRLVAPMIEEVEREKSNPYTVLFAKFLTKYFEQIAEKDTSNFATEAWNAFLEKKWVQDKRPQYWITKEELVTILYRIAQDNGQ